MTNWTITAKPRYATTSNQSHSEAAEKRISLKHGAAGLAAAVLAGGGSAMAQESLPTITIEGVIDGPTNANQGSTSLTRIPGRLQDVPQTVNVINQQTIRQQGISTLQQALGNVPGVTINLGEGGAGMNGDQFRIRGLVAKGDIYVDGLRDFGVYVRDSFAYQNIQVIKGPSSEGFGFGTTGGLINAQVKSPQLANFNEIEGTIGTGGLYRTTFDFNRKINETTAIRLVGMIHDQKFVDRDHVFSDRYGFLASIGFGLNTPTSLTLSYLHQHGKRLPDLGVPIANPDGQTVYPHRIGLPVTEFGANRANFYGKSNDLDEHNIHMVTSKFRKEVAPWLTFHNDTRLSFYDRYFTQSIAGCGTVCSADVFAGNLNTAYDLSGPGFTQDAWGIQNVSTAVMNLNVGGYRHQLVTGIDIFHQNNRFAALAATGRAVGAGTVANPDFWGTPGTWAHNGNGKRGDGTNIAVFATDRWWLNSQFSVLGGLRLDYYKAEYQTQAAGIWGPMQTPPSETFVSPKLSFIWEPNPAQTYYVTWSRSTTGLAGQYLTNDVAATGVDNATLKPEENELWEIGTKQNFLNNRLGVTAALFQINKDNHLVDDGTGNLVSASDTQRIRIQGAEIGVTGQITDAWAVQFAYAYLDGQVRYNSAVANANPLMEVTENQYRGNKAPFVSDHNLSIWTTFELSKLMDVGPGKLLAGAGIRYASEYFTHARNGSIIPEYFSVDGMLTYEYGNWRFALNGYNLTNELNYDGGQHNNSPNDFRGMRGRALVAAGRTITFTTSVKW